MWETLAILPTGTISVSLAEYFVVQDLAEVGNFRHIAYRDNLVIFNVIFRCLGPSRCGKLPPYCLQGQSLP